MKQNTSTAVMQRRSEPHDSLDDFPTPPWATRAMCKWLISMGERLRECEAADPCANRGHMVRPLREYFGSVCASDIHDYGQGFPVRDYLFGKPDPVDFTFINPPFRLAEKFLAQARRASRLGVCMFARSAFTEGVERYNSIFRKDRPGAQIQFSERVVIHKGRLLDPDRLMWVKDKKGEWIQRKPSSATAYSWFFFPSDRIGNHTELDWFPGGTRRANTCPGDYPPGQEIHPEPMAESLI